MHITGYHKILCLFVLFFLSGVQLHAQSTISGRVSAAENDEPISFVTVYVDGTSNGTITDENGVFELTGVRPPAKLVVSHLSYLPQVKEILTKSDLQVDLTLEKRVLNIAQVQIDAENTRAKNIEHFRLGFLGNDKWGQEAVILNDSVLFFNIVKNKGGSAKPNFFQQHNFVKFEVTASEPLLIDLPRLGYTLHVDLVYYYEEPEKTSAFSYNYYKPYDLKSKLKNNRIAKNRNKAYYNSILHFCRALHSGTLEQEGYGLYYTEEELGNLFVKKDFHKISIDSNLIRISDDEMAIKGLGGSVFMICYFYNYKGEPGKVRQAYDSGLHSTSTIYIGSDSCVFTINGILPESCVTFGGAMGRKRTGAMLPKYYQPSK